MECVISAMVGEIQNAARTQWDVPNPDKREKKYQGWLLKETISKQNHEGYAKVCEYWGYNITEEEFLAVWIAWTAGLKGRGEGHPLF